MWLLTFTAALRSATSLSSLFLAPSHSSLRPEHMTASQLSWAFLSESIALGRGGEEDGEMEGGRREGGTEIEGGREGKRRKEKWKKGVSYC